MWPGYITCAVSPGPGGWQLSSADRGCPASLQAGIHQGMTAAQLSAPQCGSVRPGQAGGWQVLPPAPKTRTKGLKESMGTQKKRWNRGSIKQYKPIHSGPNPLLKSISPIDTEAWFVAHQDLSCQISTSTKRDLTCQDRPVKQGEGLWSPLKGESANWSLNSHPLDPPVSITATCKRARRMESWLELLQITLMKVLTAGGAVSDNTAASENLIPFGNEISALEIQQS